MRKMMAFCWAEGHVIFKDDGASVVTILSLQCWSSLHLRGYIRGTPFFNCFLFVMRKRMILIDSL